ncbi:ATP-dependent RNA helicase HrpA [Halomonas dongshanensis]|uniref:ATP-dependent RNA helicase HrpA n=1 Tax=Halomonas dongshanensis TaxID=2890835 RepID=A0ABT2EEE3_9GAMM|nr:ATP-dependent RNA helicase HrpA [Halomonas dongshanensis]MCS2609007.1 ATP-dependent RNA helicase HrpA [Halomonas dongshanensis]
MTVEPTVTNAMPEASQDAQRLAALTQRSATLMHRDTQRIDRRLRNLERRLRERKPIDRGLNELTGELERAEQRIAKRNAVPVSLDYPAELPVVERREDIVAALREHQVVIVAGETGSGKTTQLPKMCLEIGRGRRGLIGHTQPRRLAARSVANRLAEELKVTLGEQVGYQVRFTDQTNDATLVKLMTDGILLAETQHDPLLLRYDTLIIDEAHERSLNIDFLLGYLKRLLPQRPDLKIVITSATIDVDRFAAHFGTPERPAPIVEVSGRTYPVEVRYRPLVRDADDEEDRTLQEGIVEAVAEIETIEREKGWLHGPRDVLVFLPGEREIREVADVLRRADFKGTEILPLYARLSNEEQNRVFAAHRGRRIVLATNVAETSLTVPGIRYVIDPGLVRISRYSYRSKIQRLPVEPVSQASANQRKGRCGRVAEGVCIRLFDEADFIARPEFTDPEIQRTNLASVILSMLSLKLGDIEAFPFVDPPDGRFVKDGFRLLFELGAVSEQQRITELGRKLARLPIDPRLARMVLAGAEFGSLREVLIVVSALAIQDPRERPADKRQAADQAHLRWHDPGSDFVALINLWHGIDNAREALSSNQLRRWCREHFINYLRVREWHDTFRQLRQLLRDMAIEVPPPKPRDPDESEEQARQARHTTSGKLHQALLSGLLSHIGMLTENREYLGARNRKFNIHPGSGMAKKSPKWLMAFELVETSKLFARTVAKIEPQWIEPQALHLVKRSYSDPHWEMKRAQVVAKEQITLFGLPIVSGRRVHYGTIDPDESRTLFIRRALVEGEYRTQAAFFAHNRALIEEVESLEDRARRRDILVDEETLFGFYDERIPAHVVNGKGFEHWRKQAERETPDLLKFDRAALQARDAQDVNTTHYPDQLVLAGVTYPLAYHFEPDAEDDGVTLTLPAAMLSQLPEHALDWLVPGLLREKCIALMKSLPKSLRRQVVPIPDWVDAALESLVADNRPLTEALGEFIRRRTGVRVHPDDWRLEQLPAHLKMNLRVVDHEGKTLGQGRQLSELVARFERAASEGAQALAKNAPNAPALGGLPQTPLPASSVTTQAGIRVEAFPALVHEGSEFRVVLFDHPAKAEAAHREGVARLAIERLPSEVRAIKRLADVEKSALLFAKVGSKQALIDDLLLAVFTQVMAEAALPRGQAALEARLEEIRPRLVPHAEALLVRVKAALTGHLAVTKVLKGKLNFALALVYSDISAQMQRLVYPGFICAAGDWLAEYPRYTEAALIRLEKAGRERGRDQLLMHDVQALEARFDARRESERRGRAEDPALVEFGWWIQELRVSLFAQQLGTRMPVSAKRLEKHWQEITSV